MKTAADIIDRKEILLRASSSGEAFRKVFACYRALDKKWSQQFLCRKAGIPSRSYLESILKGQRIIGERHIAGLCSALSFTHRESVYLRHLIAWERRERPEGGKVKENLVAQKRSLALDLGRFPRHSTDGLLLVKVLASFDVAGERVPRSWLYEFFSHYAREDVDMALQALLDNKFVRCDDAMYFLTRDPAALFQTGGQDKQHLDFVEDMIDAAKSSVSKWFHKPCEANFQSAIVSVDKVAFQETLPKIRKAMIDSLVALESRHGDALIHFNVQIYPGEGFAIKQEKAFE